MKLHFCIGGLLGCLAGAVRAGFVPILLTPASYNQDMVVEAGAPAPQLPGGYTTASMDQGTGNANFSWYEQGYNAAAPTTGLPKAGTTFTHQSLSDHYFQMAPSYRSNNAVVLDATLTNATLTLVTSAAWSKLSLLESGGHNGVVFTYQVHHQNGDAEAGSGSIPDWYNGASPAWTANGRVDVGTFAFDSVNGNNPRLYAIDLALVDTTNPVTRIDFSYSSGTGHGVIMAVSGSTGGAFTPIAVGGYNVDVVVEADGPQPGGLTGVTTATMEDGTTNTQGTWYETGYVRNAPGTGLPPAGGTFTNLSARDHVYTTAPSYRTNNAVFLGPAAKTATITPAAPAAFPALSFLAAVGNGPLTVGCAVRHASGAVENSTLVVPDWFGGTPVAWVANGRVAVSAKTVSSVNSGQPRLYSLDVPLANTTSPVTGITLTWVTGGASTFAAVLAVSGGSVVLPLAGDDFNANTEAAALMLQEWYNSSGLWDTTGWWNAANCLEALENTALQDNGRFYLNVLTNTYNLNSAGGFLNSYYDDEGWWANA